MSEDSDWHSLGALLYRKWHVYDMNWKFNPQATKGTSSDESLEMDKIDLELYLVCGASFGGPVALLLKRPSPLSNDDADSKLPKFLIYSSAGKLLANVHDYNEENNVIGIGWSDHEQLMIVTETGKVCVYDIHGKIVTQFLLFEGGSNTGVKLKDCHFWGDGVATITNDFNIFVAEGMASPDISLKLPRVYSMRTGLGSDRAYTAMAIVPPLLSRSGLLEVLIGTSDNSVLVIHEGENEQNIIEDQLLQKVIESAITKISVAPNGRFLACYRKDGVLTVMSSAFTTKVLDFDTKSMSRPREIAWCGVDAVCLQWRNTGIVMVGPFGDWLNFPYDVPLHLVAEPDCCRIITSTGCEILQRVPAATVAIRSVGSTDPAALMFDAMEAFEDGDPKSDDNIRSIASSYQLYDAVGTCVSAAAGEFDISKQQALLKAASYGKAFCPETDPGEFIKTANRLRILNDVRQPNIGLPLTVQQYNRLTPEALVHRLAIRNFHYLALKICEVLQLNSERILIHWACEKVKRLAARGSADEDINAVVTKQLAPHGSIVSSYTYCVIAEVAHAEGRRRLATLILEKVKRPGNQIPLLLKMKEEELALQKAVNSEDADLIYSTLISLESRLPVNASQKDYDAFYRVVHAHPEAANLMKIYYRHRSQDRALHNLLMYNKNHLEAAAAALKQGLAQPSAAHKVQYLKEVSQLLSTSKDNQFVKGMTDEQIELLELQKNLEMRCQTKRFFLDLNVSETIYELVMLSIVEPADARWIDQEVLKIAKKFKVSDKALWYLKIRCYSEKEQWHLLKSLANEKRSPVGYKPFAMVCKKYARSEQEIAEYVDKTPDLEERYDLLVTLKMWSKAFEVAVKLKDPYKLHEVGKSCQDPALERAVQDKLSKL